MMSEAVPGAGDSFSGVVFVRRGDDILREEAWGAADREAGRRNTTDTPFQIASNSKRFAAAAILLLEERGALSVADPVSRFLGDVPERWRPITLHHLLTHTSGIGHWQDFPQIDLGAAETHENLLRIFGEAPLHFEPGEQYRYSSPAYVLLARIAEQVSGRAYATLLADEFFGPVGMERTGVGSAAPFSDAWARGYSGETAVPSFDLDGPGMGAGDMWSTARDVSRWNQALARGEVLSNRSRATMTTWHATTSPAEPGTQPSGYGYGLGIGELEGRRAIAHSGGNAGFVSYNIWFPEEDGSVTVLSNDDTTDVRAIARDLAIRLPRA